MSQKAEVTLVSAASRKMAGPRRDGGGRFTSQEISRAALDRIAPHVVEPATETVAVDGEFQSCL